jgi:hypothetical protein
MSITIPGPGDPNKTMHYFTPVELDDVEEAMKNSKRQQILRNKGFFDRTDMYRFNSNGYRCKNFSQDRESIVLIGCSFAFGYGEYDEYTLSGQLSQKLNRYVWNLGFPGGSADMSYRILEEILPIIKPKAVVFLETFAERREFKLGDTWARFTTGDIEGVPNVYPNTYTKEELAVLYHILVDPEAAQLNLRKNTHAMRALSQSHDANFYTICHRDSVNPLECIASDDISEYGWWARDFMHPGRVVFDIVTDKLVEQMRPELDQ